jgi:hypothetical protein
MKLYEYDKWPCGCHLHYYDPKEVDARIAELIEALKQREDQLRAAFERERADHLNGVNHG